MRRLILVLLGTACAALTHAQTPQLVQDILPGIGSSDPDNKIVYKNKLYFFADDGTNGNELWSYDGVAASMVYNLNPGGADGASSGGTKAMAVFNDKLYFCGDNGTAGLELMVYDGVNPPALAYDLNPGISNSAPFEMAVINNRLYFSALSVSNGREMFIFNGTTAPTLIDINAGAPSSIPNSFTELGGNVFFSATTAATGKELFGYNPGNNTVAVASDIEQGTASSGPVLGTVLNNKLYFAAKTAANGYELWVCDGSSVSRVTDVAPGNLQGLASIPEAFNGMIYFGGSATGSAYQLYRYNPANGTASLVYNIFPGGTAFPSNFFPYKGKLYFTAQSSINNNELWVFDGANTTQAADINPGPDGSDPFQFVLYNSRLFFTAETAATGRELFSLYDPTSVTQTPFEGTVTVAPNPAEEDVLMLLGLKAGGAVRVKLTDATGKAVWQQTQTLPAGESKVPLPIGRLAAGTYFYHVSSGDGRQTSGRLIRR